MSGESLETGGRGGYWDDRYERVSSEQVSWYQPRPDQSLALIEALGVAPTTPVIDVGGGSSTLVDELVDRAFTDITILDVSAKALAIARRRVGDQSSTTWLEADIVTWEPSRQWGLWHDRAVFHFLTVADDRAKYLERMRRALVPGGAFIIATFAHDGPPQCSGLPVSRYDAAALVNVLHAGLGGVEIAEQRRQVHTTPSGDPQPFTWIAGTIKVDR